MEEKTSDFPASPPHPLSLSLTSRPAPSSLSISNLSPLPPPPLSPAAALDSFRDRAKAANEAASKAALDLAPDRPLPKAIATLEAKLACAAAAIAEREGALEAITRVCRTAKARLEEADTRVSSLRARCEALDAAFVQESAALREELAAAVKKAGGAWLGAEAGAGGAGGWGDGGGGGGGVTQGGGGEEGAEGTEAGST